MSTSLFLLSLLVSIAGPVLAITYLRPILAKVLHGLCDAEGGAEFWIRSAYLLAVCGTLLLTLSFGEWGEGASVVDTLRRSLWLVVAGVFGTVAFIANSVWTQVNRWLATQPLFSTTTPRTPNPAAPATTSPMGAA